MSCGTCTKFDLKARSSKEPDMSAPRDDRMLLVPSLAGAVGNLLEWYDFGLYGLFAPIFAQLFFPGQDRIASLIGAYSGFAIGFAARPVGAAVLGHLGDRVGRRAVLVCSIVLMGFATTATAILPTYHAIGIGAPILLLFMRLLQGFSVGGEFTGSVAYLVETAPGKRRGLAGSIANIGATAGMLLAAGAATTTSMLANSAEVQSWTWRIPFLFGGIIAVTGYLLRHRLRDAGYTPTASARPSLPLRAAIAEAPGAMLCALLFTSGYGIVNYLTMVFSSDLRRHVRRRRSGTSAPGEHGGAGSCPVHRAARRMADGLGRAAAGITDHCVRRRICRRLERDRSGVARWHCWCVDGAARIRVLCWRSSWPPSRLHWPSCSAANSASAAIRCLSILASALPAVRRQ